MVQDDSGADLEKAESPIPADISAFDDASPDETVQCDVNLVVVRDKARISLNGPVGVADDVLEFLRENHKDEIDKRYATQSGRKIGETSVRGDGTVLQCEIDSNYMVK